MSNLDRLESSYLELARYRQLPENHDEQLVCEALHMIRAVAHGDPDIHLALEGLSDKQLQAFKDAESVETFKKALGAFSDKSIFVIAGALEILDSSIAVMNGRPGSTLAEIFHDNDEVISEVSEIKATARQILRQLRSDVLAQQGRNQPFSVY